MEKFLPPIPAKRYFTIGEVSNLCGVKPHVLRYWEQEFTQLRPMKRRGNRRYYQRHEVLMIRKIRELLYDQGFTIVGARNKLHELAQTNAYKLLDDEVLPDGDGLEFQERHMVMTGGTDNSAEFENRAPVNIDWGVNGATQQGLQLMRRELLEIRDMLSLASL